VRALLARYQELQDVIAILGLDELNDEDRQTVLRARRIQQFLTQPFFSTEQFTGSKGVYLPLRDTLEGFDLILQGRYDHLPEQAFYMAGSIADVVDQARQMKTEREGEHA
jgi:F-type H+-transporting ATPase subunit beta